jgi:hypothetical protein
MKTIRTLLTFALLLGAVSVYAQEIRPLMKASIPFSFTVGDQSFPAGDYTISSVPPGHVTLLQSTDGEYATFVGTNPRYKLAPSAQTKLIFQHYGSIYFLSQIWTLGDSAGRELVLPNRAKESARNGSISDVTAVVANASFSH